MPAATAANVPGNEPGSSTAMKAEIGTMLTTAATRGRSGRSASGSPARARQAATVAPGERSPSSQGSAGRASRSATFEAPTISIVVRTSATTTMRQNWPASSSLPA